MAIKLGMIALAGACLLMQPAFAAGGHPAATPSATTPKVTPEEVKAYQKARGLKETGIIDAATKKSVKADKDTCKGKGGTLDLSDPCNGALLVALGIL